MILCPSLLEELGDVLVNRERMRGRISIEAARLYLTRLETTADLCSDPQPGPALTRDPDDDYLVYLARENNADVIVSGDKDLLEWSDQDPQVMTPAGFEQALVEGV